MLSLTLERIERQIRNLPVEHVYALDEDYNIILHRTDGHPSRVALSYAEVAALHGALLTHNHPGGRSFSPEDVELARDAALRELRVVTRNRRYSMRPPPGGWQSTSDAGFAQVLEEESDLLYATLDREIARGVLTSSLAELTFHNRLWEQLARRGVVRYGSEPWQL